MVGLIGVGTGSWRRLRRGVSAARRPTASAASRPSWSTWRSSRPARCVSASADAPLWLLLGQFLVGIGIGIDFPVSASYVSETMPKSARSRMVVATIALQSVGMLLGAAVAIVTLRQWTSPVGLEIARWRDRRRRAGCFCCCDSRFRKARAGSWSMAARQEARRIGQASSPGRHRGRPATAARLCFQAAGSTPCRRGARRSIRLLFSRPYRTRTMLVSVPWFLMDIATYGVGLFTPVILGAIHLSSATTGPLAAEFVDAEGTRRDRPVPPHRLSHRAVGGAALRPHPHAGRRICPA